MTELDIVSIGIWSPFFANWKDFSDGINAGDWQSEAQLQPNLIPPRERRRAPQSVKMAVEVLEQACTMASLDPATAAVVFSSAMGDMLITDYMCRILSATPALVSPTRFHNSVHNATTGYWSIVNQTHAPTNAVSAYGYTAPMAFLEAGCQASEDNLPVLLVTQEMAAPTALHSICPSDQPFSLALLITEPGYCENPMASIGFSVKSKAVNWPDLPGDLKQSFDGNFGARLLPLIAHIAAANFNKSTRHTDFEFPLSPGSCLCISVSAR
jgi:hypothetical protein